MSVRFVSATDNQITMRKRVRRLANVKNPPEAWLAGIREYVMSIFKCGAHSIHGPSHWQRVDAFGLDIAESSGADLTVVRLFALLHDSCRQDDGADLDHGPRAAEMLDRIVPTVFAIDPGRFDLLKEAIQASYLRPNNEGTDHRNLLGCRPARYREGRNDAKRTIHEHRGREGYGCHRCSTALSAKMFSR